MMLHICGKELLDDQHSCAEGAGSQPVSLGGWVAQIRKDLGVAEKELTQLKWNSGVSFLSPPREIFLGGIKTIWGL